MEPHQQIPHQDQQPTKIWMITFTDLVSLMLAFFVMLFAMSNVKVDKWSEMTDALSQSLNPSRQKTTAMPSTQFNIGTIFRKRAINLDYLAGVLEEAVAKDPLLAGAEVLRADEELVLVLPGDLLFAEGQATLAEKGRQALFNLGGVLRNIDNQIIVHGHTRREPPASDRYSGNWELSVARAVGVANELRRSGYTEDITALGFADGKYADVRHEKQRRLAARRVSIVVRATAGDG